MSNFEFVKIPDLSNFTRETCFNCNIFLQQIGNCGCLTHLFEQIVIFLMYSFWKNNNIYSLNWANYTERLFFALLHENFTLCSPKISCTRARLLSLVTNTTSVPALLQFSKKISSAPENLTCGATIFKHNIHVASDWHSNHVSHSYHILPIIIEKLSSDCLEVRRAFV